MKNEKVIELLYALQDIADDEREQICYAWLKDKIEAYIEFYEEKP